MAAAKPFDRNRIGARDDDEVGIVQGIAHGLELLHHLFGRHDPLVVVMAALLGKGLILEMKGRDTGTFESACRRLRVERIAEAGIGVGDDRHGDHIHHRGQPVDDSRE